MMRLVPGISGTLLPDRYVARHLLQDVGAPTAGAIAGGPTLRQWWAGLFARLGPTSPLRVLFDELAMPLCGWLGFSAQDVVFADRVCRATLNTPGGNRVALLLTPWAQRPSTRWADLARHAATVGASWGFVLSPPFLSIVPALGSAARESIDVALPIVADANAALLPAVAGAGRFDSADGATVTLDHLVVRASRYRDGVRADLQRGVDLSLAALTPALARARSSPPAGSAADDVGAPDPNEEALTVIFRILFVLFAESRRLVPVDAPIYADGYTLERLCRDTASGRAVGQWETLGATSRLLRIGCRTGDLQVAPFNGALFARRAAPVLEQVRRPGRPPALDGRDDALRRTLVALGTRVTCSGGETIDYRDLGVEQLGAVYERVLDIDGTSAPGATVAARSRPNGAAPRAGHRRGSRHSRRRRETGTFYTPEPLAAFVVRRTLAPLVDGRSADDILRLRVLDPAMGSGAFLVAACRYLAGALEEALVDEGRLSPDDIDEDERARLRRHVAERCLAGVDRNGTAVQLARLSLWLTTLARGRPLGFLDHHLRTGNSLIGAWPRHLHHVPSGGRARPTPRPLLDLPGFDEAVQAAVGPWRSVFSRPDDAVSDVHAKADAWRSFRSTASPLHRWRVAADLWCARWFGDDDTGAAGAAETRALIAATTTSDRMLPADRVRSRTAEATRAGRLHGFFHWPLEFPDDFFDADGHERRDGGFDAVLGNPPWEMVRRDDGDRDVDGSRLVPYVRQSGQYPSCASGQLNLYQAFIDRALTLTRRGGRIGLVVPWGLATDDGAADLRRRVLDATSIDLIVGLDNAAALFPIHRGVRMAIVTASVGRATTRVRVVPGVRQASQLRALPERGVDGVAVQQLTPSDLREWTGPLMRVPDLRRDGDVALLRGLVNRHPRIGSADGWAISFGRELNATDVRDQLRAPSAVGAAIIEGKQISPFVADIRTARRLARTSPAYRSVADRIAHARVGYRDVSAVGNRLTMIAAVIPAGVATTHTVFCQREPLPTPPLHFLCACLNSYVVNAVVRMLMGSHVTASLMGHLPVPRWSGGHHDRRVAMLAQRLAGGRGSDDASAEVQGLVARRFGLTRAEFVHVLDGFPLVAQGDRDGALRWFDGAEPDPALETAGGATAAAPVRR